MIIDTIDRLSLYEHLIPDAGKIARAFAEADASAAPCEVREKTYATKPDEKRRYEVHFHTIDLMMAREGKEMIHLCPMEELVPAEHLPGGADGRKMEGMPRGTAVLLEAGFFCAIFPGEAHMVGGMIGEEAGEISKWVVKDPCLPEFAVDEI